MLKIVDGKEPGSRATQRTPVKLGARTPGFVEVVDGLALGDMVVTAGQQRIQKDGTLVRVVELGKPGNGASPSPSPACAASGAAGTMGAASAGSAVAAADAPVPTAADTASGPRAAAQPMAAAPVAATTTTAASPNAVVAPLPGPNPCQPAGTPSRAPQGSPRHPA